MSQSPQRSSLTRIYLIVGVVVIGTFSMAWVGRGRAVVDPRLPLIAGQERSETRPMDTLRAELEAGEYRFSQQEDGAWTAPNRAHDLRARVTPSGIDVTSRTKGSEAFELTLVLASWGRSESMRNVSASRDKPALDADGNRVTILHPGIEEWFLNEARGLEHGFTIEAQPQGPGTLALVLAVEGSVQASSDPLGQEVLFKDARNHTMLRYAELAAQDRTGADVPALLIAEGGSIRIEIDDSRAAYPLTIDPLMISPGWTAEGDQANAEFGFSAATAGDVNGDGYSDVVVGAWYYDGGQVGEGAAFLYLGSDTGLSTTPAWSVTGGQSGALFGTSVASAGDVNGDGYDDVIVGARLYSNGQSFEGAAFVYLGDSTGLSGTPVWTAEGGQPQTEMGISVGTAGDVNGDGYDDVIVGAFAWENGEMDEGRALVYQGSASGPAATPSWTVESDQAGALYGLSVATAGDVNADGYADVIVGAHHYDNGEADEGAAFVYLGSSSGLATVPAWVSESDQAGALYGSSVATAGDVNGDGYADIIIGAPGYDVTIQSKGPTLALNAGRAYVYFGSVTGPATTPAWIDEGGSDGEQVGNAVATAGDIDGDGYADVIVGVPGADYSSIDGGAAFVYVGSESGLLTTAAWGGSQSQNYAHYGNTVATAGDVNGDGYSDILVGAKDLDDFLTDEGAVFAYYGSAGSLMYVPAWTAEGQQAYAEMGFAVASAGDVNGDGYSDVIIGARLYDNGEFGEGRAFVYLGSAAGLSPIPSWSAEGNQILAGFGFSVAGAGDVNGDGYSDVIVGAYSYDDDQTNEGRVFLYLGSPVGLAAAPAWFADGNQQDAQFGWSVGTAGDVNGDGYSDIIVGAPYFDTTQADAGKAFIFQGSPSGPGAVPAWTAAGTQSGGQFGYSIATAGDVNGDGYSDVIVGEPLLGGTLADQGRALLYLGSASGASTIAAWTATGGQAGARFGFSVATAGDLNADGYADVIVGAPFYDDSYTDEGAIFYYLGSSSGLTSPPLNNRTSFQTSANLGVSVAPAGDVDGDGFSDILAGAPFYDYIATDDGTSWIGFGAPSGSIAFYYFTRGDQLGAELGAAVASAGDVNGDGFSDALIGARLFDNGETDEGMVFLHLGGGGAGLDRLPRQVRSDGTAPISLLGKSDASDSFRIRVRGRTPAGRGEIRLEYEVASLSSPFGPSASVTADLDTGAPGPGGSVADFDELISGLPLDHYKWRARFASRDPFFPRSPWFSIPGNAPTETDLRLQAAVVAPAAPQLTILNAGLSAQLTWPAVPNATAYDIVQGDVGQLLLSGGDFSEGTMRCVANDLMGTLLYDRTSVGVGEAIFFLVRGVNPSAAGSYDVPGASQVGSRDAEIAASTGACP